MYDSMYSSLTHNLFNKKIVTPNVLKYLLLFCVFTDENLRDFSFSICANSQQIKAPLS